MESSDQPAAPGEYPPLHGLPLLFLTAAIATASFMEILDMTIVNVSVPAISGSLGVSTSEGTWQDRPTRRRRKRAHLSMKPLTDQRLRYRVGSRLRRFLHG
jgi:hypothetical protein